MAKPTPVQLNAAAKQFEGSGQDTERQPEGSPADMRNERPRIMKLAKAMSAKVKK